MRRMNRILQALSLIIPVLLVYSQGHGEIIDRIVAIVNEDIITLSELDTFRKSLYARVPEKRDWLSIELDLEAIRKQALNAMIEEKLLDQEADRQMIRVGETAVEKALESIRQEQGLTQQQLEMALEAEGLSLEEYTLQVEKSLKRSRLINLEIRSKIEMNDEDLKAYYEKHMRDYAADEAVRISHILLPIPQDSTQEAEGATRALAEAILARLENGEDFDDLALEYAQTVSGVRGGDIGYFKRGEMIPIIEKTAFNLKVGGVAGPIRTPEGFFLVKVTEKKEGNPLPFQEVREKVEKDYYRYEAERRYQQWMNQLKERSFIEVKL